MEQDISLGGYEFSTTRGGIQRADVTPALPRVSVATASKQRSDFSELDTLGQFSIHHGRGQELFEDEAAFYDSHRMDTRVQGQWILAPAKHTVTFTPAMTGTVVSMTFDSYTNKMFALVRGTANTDNALYYYDTATASFLKVVSATLDPLLQATDSVPTRIFSMGSVSATPSDNRATSVTNFLVISRNNLGAAVYQTRGGPSKSLNFIYSSDGGLTWAAMATTAYGGVANQGWGSKASVFTLYRDRLAFDAGNNAVTLRAIVNVEDGTQDIVITGLGSAGEPINSLIGLGDNLLVMKPEGLFMIIPNTDGSYSVRLAIDYRQMRSPDNGKASCTWNGRAYFNVNSSLFEFNGTALRSIGPDLGAHQPQEITAEPGGPIIMSPTTLFGGSSTGPGVEKRGPITALTPSTNWLYATMQSVGSDDGYYLMAYAGAGWHELMDTTETVDFAAYFPALGTYGVNSPAVWLSEGTSLCYYILSDATENRYDYLPADFTTSGYVVTSRFDVMLPEVEKEFRLFHIDMDNPAPDSCSILVEYALDKDPTWQTLATLYQTTDVLFPGGGRRAKAIRFRFTLTGTMTASPRMRGWFVRFMSRPPGRYGWNVPIEAEKNNLKSSRSVDVHTGSELRETLYSLRDRRGPLRFDDGNTMSGRLNLVGNPDFEITDDTGLPTGWTKTSGTVTVERSPLYSEKGIYSCYISGAYQEGIEQTVDLPVNHTGTYTISAYIKSGIQIQVIQNGVTLQSMGGASIPLDDPLAPEADPWVDTGIAPLSKLSRAFTVTSTVYPVTVKITNIDIAGSYIDCVELYEGEDDGTPFVGPNEPRCFRVDGTPTTASYRPPYWLVYIATITELKAYTRVQYGDNGVTPERVTESKFTVALREAW